MKLIITTIVEPATPVKKTISSRRIKKIANAIASTIVAHHSGGTYFLDEASDNAHPRLLKHLPLGIAVQVTFKAVFLQDRPSRGGSYDLRDDLRNSREMLDS